MIQLDTISVQGVGDWNEDSLIIHNKQCLYGVLDGVSSLVPYRNDKNQTGGYIASNLVKTYFEQLTDVTDLMGHIEVANLNLRQAMLGSGIEMEQKDVLWGTALAMVRISEHKIEYIQTGDCMILAVYEDGEVRVLTRQQVAHLERRAFEIWRQGIANGLRSRDELFETVRDILKSNRYKSNVDGGYGVLNGEEEALTYFESGTMNRTRVTHIILLTDGLFWPVEAVPSSSHYWDFVAHKILQKGLRQYTNEILELEENDPECMRYIRFKKSDDKTGLVVTLTA